MVMSWIFAGSLGLSLVFSLLSGKGQALSAAVTAGAQSAVTLWLSICGAICLWSGVGRLMEAAGVTGALSRLLMPVLGRIFPSCRKKPSLRNDLCANVCANLLGLGNAATPLGIRAAKGLVNPADPHTATDELCRLITLNTASIQLIPATVAAVRASLGCGSPFDILPAVWVTSFCSAGMGLLAAWIFGKLWSHA